MSDAVIIDMMRTASGRGKPVGALSAVHPARLLATVIQALTERTGVVGEPIDDVVAGSGLAIDVIDTYEVSEAFATVPLAWAREFNADPGKLNPRGGAISPRHPLGASGARILATMLNHLEANGGRFALQTLCEGGGMANATSIERI